MFGSKRSISDAPQTALHPKSQPEWPPTEPGRSSPGEVMLASASCWSWFLMVLTPAQFASLLIRSPPNPVTIVVRGKVVMPSCDVGDGIILNPALVPSYYLANSERNGRLWGGSEFA
ncbi:uncharacterized protein EV422DRAFT_503605 [Fimicolochytrium jonesii]|uniref:uncharacterized protein n=1 Tax=Fimicolochytrium jonesii TaxID=1396493 RepID=UPI0022FE989E|nr:uncharacterized protein EV422DRAFT_503605 [Fimicolochytrium jonesii]KAI8824793.1 hypothetical protein EV422DRAFT_503605 [Fimicolochytrium jonesii]